MNDDSPVSTVQEGKKSIRFNTFLDIMLLREVVAQNPFGQNGGKKSWEQVTQQVSIYLPGISSRTCRERTLRLLKLFKSDDLASLRKGAESEELLAEKEQLLQQIKDLEAERLEEEREMYAYYDASRRKQQMETVGNVLRSSTLPALGGNSSGRNSSLSLVDDDTGDESDASNSRKRPRLSNSNREEEWEMRKRQLDLDEKRLALDQKKFELETEKWRKERDDRAADRKMIFEMIQVVLKYLDKSVNT